MATPREHVEEIRINKFSIGREDNPLTEDLHHAVKHLSTELYTKDVHFLMELIQNAEDNEYPPNVEPSLEFVITTRDVTGVGASATLLVFNNELGFTKRNIESLCSIGRSTKKGKRQGGYIGEKGIGFKSVFLITKQPYIFSNGYKIRFNEIPPHGTKIGYIVPEWIDEKPSIEDLQEVYGCELPNTIIILPLRPEKVDAVKEQLANIHPEVILFMSKIRKLSVRDYNEDSALNRVNAIRVSRETEFRTTKNEHSQSFILHLSAQENEEMENECSYYMWRQCFPVQEQSRIEERKDMDKSVITLAFPFEERLNRAENKIASGIYAFLPTEMITGFPFIIQADFLLVSSRESIIFDNKWNQGILDCIPPAFCSAFISLLCSVQSAPPMSRAHFFKYLPIDIPSCPELRRVRDAIQAQLKQEEVILCETQNAYCMPKKARRILPAFRDILDNASKYGLESPSALWSTGVFIVHSCMEEDQFSRVLQFLGVGFVPYQWYSQCILSSSGWVAELSEDLYVQLLCFLSQYWERGISTSLQNFPFFKFVNDHNRVDWASLSDISHGHKQYFSSEVEHISWLARWSGEFGHVANFKFMPDSTQMAMRNLDYQGLCRLRVWLNDYPKITELSVSSFSKQLVEQAKVSMSSKFVVTVTQFLYFSYTDKHIDWRDFQILCSDLPIPDDSGCIFRSPKAKLVPASISKWAKLFESNPWAKHGLVALSRDYLKPPPCAYGLKGEDDLESFIRNDLGAVDIPFLRPLDVAMPGLSSPLEKEKVFLLLEWIQHLTVNYQTLPEVFKRSIAEGRWLRTHKGCQSPRVSFLFNSEWQSAGFQLKDLPFINNSFYGKTMDDFKRALQQMGVVVEFGKGCDLITEHLQMHTELQVITRLYKYLHRFHWKPTDSNPVKIWIPRDGGLGGEWKDSKLCAVHDDNGLFQNRLEILDNFYEEALLPFFSSYLGVALHPTIEDYCSLWLNWVSTGHQVSAGQCCSIWRNILKHWTSSSEKIKRCLRKGPLRLPAYTSIEDIQLSAPNETFIPDDLKLKELFMRASASPKFAWHPNPSDPEIPLDSLFSTYIHLGAQNISQATEKADISVSSNISLRKIPAGKGMVKVGLYRIILSYLARPSFKLSPDKRHKIVSTLVESTVYEVAEPFTIEYSLSLPAGNGVAETVKARTTSLVRWEKNKGRILIHVSDTHNRKENMSLATDLAEVISAGLLSNYPDLVAGLCEMVKIGCILGFDDDAVNYMLQCNNFQMFVEDKSFLGSHFPEVNESVLPSKELRGFYGCSSGGRKSISSPAKATSSTGYFSVDCPKRWEKNLFSLKQQIINVEESTSDSVKKKLVRLLFPLGTADIGQLNNCLLKLIGDAQIKILIILEALGGNEISGMVPSKLDYLLCSPELKKHLGGSEKTEQTSSSSPSSSGNDEVDVETLKAAVGAMVLNYYGKEGEQQQY